MIDALSPRKTNNAAIQAQDTVRQMKAELAKEKLWKMQQKSSLMDLYYHGMYFSKACWKDDPRVVKRNLKKLKSETAKYKALKEKVKGFGWE